MAGGGFGHVYRTVDGRYRATYVYPAQTGARHTAPCVFADIGDAEGWLRAELRLITTGGWTPPSTRTRPVSAPRRGEPGRPTFAVFATSYLNGRDDLLASTRSSQLAALHNHLIPAFGPLSVDAIDRAAVHSWWASYGTRTPAARTSAYVVLKHVMEAAVHAGLASKNPCE